MGRRKDIDSRYDERSIRRLKRAHFDIREFEINAFSHTVKRTLKDRLLDDGMVDADYLKFWNYLGECAESRSSDSEHGYGSGYGADEDDADPQYLMFLRSLRVDGKSYVFEAALNDKVSLSIKYEAEGESNDQHQDPIPRKSRKIPHMEKMEAAKDLRNLPTKDNILTRKNMGNVVSKDKMGPLKNMGNVIGSEARNSVGEEDLIPEPVNHILGRTDGCFGKGLHPKGNHLFDDESEYEIKVDMVDECYQTFLNSIKEEGDCLVFTIEGEKPVKYEGPNVESSSDSEVLVSYDALDFVEGNHNPFETSKVLVSFVEEDEGQCPGNPGSNDSVFRKKLMAKLREPFDKKEYEELLQDITIQRPKEARHIDLRGPAAVRKTYSRDELSPSYLEQYGALKRKINAARLDQCKILNLLRGFYFWLQNLAHEGAFLPWKDQSCLEVLPRVF